MYDPRPDDTGYPRLFFSAADLPALRAKLAHEDCAATWGRLLAGCEQMLRPDPPPLYPRHLSAAHLAFAALITGRADFAAKAQELALATARAPSFLMAGERNRPRGGRTGLGTGGALVRVACPYDWLYDQFTAAERAELRTAMQEQAFAPFLHDIHTRHFHTECYTSNGVGVVAGPMLMAALLLADELDTREVAALAERQLRRLLDAHCPDGGYTEGPLYWNYCLRHLLMGAEALRRRRGVDLYYEPFLHQTGDYALHYILPWLTQCAAPADALSSTHLWPPLAALAAYHRRPEWQWLARRLLRHDWGDDGEGLEYSLFYLIFYDPAVPAAPPTPTQTTRLFSGLQNLALRSDWSDDAIHLLWLNGPNNCHHNHRHLNSFTLSAYGERLLMELGKYNYTDERDYRKLTDGHNSLMVDGAGQLITTDESISCLRVRAGQWGTVYGEFQCLREEAGATIATGHTVNAYAGRLRTFDRTLAFVQRRFIFLHDAVELAQAPPVALEWRFHAGGEVAVTADGALFSTGAARLALRLLDPADYTLATHLGPEELPPPGRPVPCFDVRRTATTATHDLCALLVPYRAAVDVPPCSLARDGAAIVIRFGPAAWRYDPARRKLAPA